MSGVHFCVTCSRGMNALVTQEIGCINSDKGTNYLIIEDTPEIEGKVFFTARDEFSPECVLRLRLVERVFLVIYRESRHQLTPNTLTEYSLLSLIEQQMSQIECALNIWKERFGNGAKCVVHTRKRRHSSTEDKVQQPIDDIIDAETVRVRVSIKVTGSCRSIKPNEVRAGILSSWILNGYKMVEGDADVTLNIICSDALVMLGVQLTQMPLSLRSYTKCHGLRSTTCAAMVLLANIKPGQIVLDPMCGVGAVLLEASNTCPQAMYIGIDNDVSQIEKASCNRLFYSEVALHTPLHLQLLHADVRGAGLLSGSVDVILTDLPFGQKHTVSGSLHELYLQSCREFYRLLAVGGRAVVLTSKHLLDSLRSSCETAGLRIAEEHYITLGRTEAYIVSIYK